MCNDTNYQQTTHGANMKKQKQGQHSTSKQTSAASKTANAIKKQHVQQWQGEQTQTT